MYKANIKRTLSHALLYSFIDFKYVILILRKEKHFLGRFGLYFGGYGEKLKYFGIWGAKAKTFRELRIFQGFGEISALSLKSKVAQNPLGASPLAPVTCIQLHLYKSQICFHSKNVTVNKKKTNKQKKNHRAGKHVLPAIMAHSID